MFIIWNYKEWSMEKIFPLFIKMYVMIQKYTVFKIQIVKMGSS